MAVVKEYQKVLSETRNVNPLFYLSPKDGVWKSYIAKTKIRFVDPDFFTMLEQVTKHIKGNRQYNENTKKYKYGANN